MDAMLGMGALVALMYESVLEPAGWRDALQTLAGVGGARGASISLADTSVPSSNIIDTFGQSSEAVAAYHAYYASFDPLIRLGPALTEGRWISDWEHLGPAYGKSAYYNEFMLPNDNHAVLISPVWQRGSQVALVALQRSRSQGAFDSVPDSRLELLTSHLRRAARLHFDARALREQSERSVAALEAIAMPVLLLEQSRKVVFANASARRLLESGRQLAVRNGQLAAAFQDAALQKALAAAAAPQGQPRWVRLAATPGNSALQLVVAPVGAQSEYAAEWQRPLISVMVSCLDPEPRSVLEALSTLYGLTGAEARVAVAVAEGLTPAQVAELHAISVQTVRQQLKLVYAKTGTGRQASLTRLITLLQSAAPASQP